jgi:hypothetical protein
MKIDQNLNKPFGWQLGLKANQENSHRKHSLDEVRNMPRLEIKHECQWITKLSTIARF